MGAGGGGGGPGGGGGVKGEVSTHFSPERRFVMNTDLARHAA